MRASLLLATHLNASPLQIAQFSTYRRFTWPATSGPVREGGVASLGMTLNL